MVVRGIPMNHSPYFLFHQTPEQSRRSGARGGKAQARNRRDRLRAELHTTPHFVTSRARPLPTVAEAIAVLDAQFPWLQGAEKRMVAQR